MSRSQDGLSLERLSRLVDCPRCHDVVKHGGGPGAGVCWTAKGAVRDTPHRERLDAVAAALAGRIAAHLAGQR